VYIVKRGELTEIRGGKVDASGRLTGGSKVAQLRAGDCFGERAVLYHEACGSTVVAAGRCELVCIGVQQLKEVLGQDLNTCLQLSFVRAALKGLPVFSHLSPPQHQQIAQAMEVRRYEPGQKVEEGLRLVVVLDGEVVGIRAGASVTHGRGQACQDTELLRLQKEGGRPGGPGSDLGDLAAGADGCRLATLGQDGLERAMRELGLAAIGEGGGEALDYMRKMLLAKKVPVFSQLSEKQVDNLVKSLVLRKYTQGAQVLRKGDVGDAFFVLASGNVNVLVENSNPRVLQPGCCFGERSVLFDEPRSATIEVSSATAELWSLDQATFQQVVTQDMRSELMHRIRLQDRDFDLKSLRHIRLIGAGSFGSVRLVEHRRTLQRYALKRVRKKDGEVPEDVQREYKILEEVDLPFVLRLVKTFESPSSIYLLTELITGGQLCEEVNHKMGLLNRKQAQFYIGTLVLILESLHHRSIIYRDLKPENVMLDSQGYLKLVDFGLAKKLEEGEARTYTIVGTPLYIAPEVLLGTGYGYEVDIWSLGVMLYELVCGSLPFGDGADQHDVLLAVLNEQLVFPGRYNDQAGKKLISGMLCRQPQSRLGSVGGWDEIKGAKFFKAGTSSNFFAQIAGREVKPPIVPTCERYSNEKELAETVGLSDADELCNVDSARDRTLAVFRRFDVNGDGLISRLELSRVLKALDAQTFTDDALDQLLNFADSDGDGYISLEEFVQWISSDDADSIRRAMDLDIHS